jgi:hypothetical protein
MIDFIKNTTRLEERNPTTEYYYLVVHKKTREVLLKSLVDIHSYKVNCSASNVMQINWDSEFKHREYVAENRGSKMIELLQVVQTACRKQIENMAQFVACDIGSLM